MTTMTTPALPVRVTKSLLGYGVIAGPIYVVVVAAQAVTRAGFDPTRHPASVLSNGGALGWIQTANFLVTGAMTIAAAVGIWRAVAPGRLATWSGLLVAGYGVGVLAAGIFRADPVPGFPPGTPDEVTVTWHGVAHLLSATIGFAGLIAACFVLASWFARNGKRGWAWYSRLTAVLFATGFLAVASGTQSASAVLAFTAAILLGWAWLTAVSLCLYRAVGPGC